jgi:LPS export ABC transporter protein LptC
MILSFSHSSLANEKVIEEMPLLESTDLELLYSSDAVVWAKICTPKLLQYQNGDGFYPEGVYVECYDKEKKIVATLRANTVYRYAESDSWELRGDVEVKGYQGGEQQQLNTEELHWNLKTKKIFTNKFVRLETPHELLTGHGLEATQDLNYYTLTLPEGFVEVDSSMLE